MNFAKSWTEKEMSGQVQLARYMHLPMMVQYGSRAAFFWSLSDDGDMLVVRQKDGQGVLTMLQFSMWKLARICVMNCSWLS